MEKKKILILILASIITVNSINNISNLRNPHIYLHSLMATVLPYNILINNIRTYSKEIETVSESFGERKRASGSMTVEAGGRIWKTQSKSTKLDFFIVPKAPKKISSLFGKTKNIYENNKTETIFDFELPEKGTFYVESAPKYKVETGILIAKDIYGRVVSRTPYRSKIFLSYEYFLAEERELEIGEEIMHGTGYFN